MFPYTTLSLETSALLSGLVLLIGLYFLISFVASWYRLRRFPGPVIASVSYLYMLAVCLTGRKASIYKDLNKKYGPLVRIGPNDLITDDPDIIRRISGARSAYIRSSWYKNLRVDTRGDTLMSTTDTATHDKLKAQLSAGYGGKENPTLENGIDEQLGVLIDLIQQKYISRESILRPLDFARLVQYFTLDSITRIAYGQSFGFLKTDSDVYGYIRTTEKMVPFLAACTDIPILGDIFFSPLLLWLMGPKETDNQGPGIMYKIAKEIVAPRFGPDATDQHDMLGAFVRHGVPQWQCETEVIFQLSAGSDTTSAAIQSIMLYLTLTPNVYKRLQEEIDNAVARGKISSPATADEGKGLEYLQAVIYEGMRINIPFAGLAMKEVPVGGDILLGKFVPAGTRIGQNVLGAQRATDIFGEDVDVFRPDRWLNVTPARRLAMTQTTDLVFGHGRWSCIGKSIAFMELNKIFIELLRRFDFQALNPTRPWEEYDYNLFFHSNQWVRVTERGSTGKEY